MSDVDLTPVIEKLEEDRPDLPVSQEECPCYKCSGSEYREVNGMKIVKNNMEFHTYGKPCRDCGEPRTDYLDLGRKGRYVCSECR